MKKAYTLLGIIILLSFSLKSCSTYKDKFQSEATFDNAITNAIIDFSESSRLYKKSNVFSVSIVEIQGNENLVVRIIKNHTKMLLTDSVKVGSKDKLPSRYFEKENKLFFWWDSNYPLTEDALDIYGKYDLLQDDEDGWVKFPDFTINDAQKAAHYYFCKNDLRRYKKVTTNKALGYYPPPKFNCN